MSNDSDNDKTKSSATEFDFSAFPSNTLFHDRRGGRARRAKVSTDAIPEVPDSQVPGRRRAKKERRRRIDPTTFDKQYTDDEMEFMNAVQRFKEQSGKAFPSYGEVLKIAVGLGYRHVSEETDSPTPIALPDPSSLEPT